MREEAEEEKREDGREDGKREEEKENRREELKKPVNIVGRLGCDKGVLRNPGARQCIVEAGGARLWPSRRI